VTTVASQVVDSHVHLWDRSRFDYAWLNDVTGTLSRDFLPADLVSAMSRSDVEVVSTVFVQADCRADQSLAEAEWVNGMADTGAPVSGIVAAARIELGDREALARLSEISRVVGVRRLLQDAPPGFALQDSFVYGVQSLARFNFSMDLCVREWQLREVTTLVSACPEVAFVLDHLGKPTISNDAFPRWAADMTALAQLPNVTCKLSGLATEAPAAMRSSAALRPWLEHALAAFGAQRCMFGSDWPVLTAAGTYEWWVDVVLDLVGDLTVGERARVLSETALETYDPLRRAVPARES
jgi:L-fuconolactonase